MKNGVVVEAKTHKYHLRYLDQLRWAARKNRFKETESEKTLWNEVLRQKKLGVKFTRQKPVDRFILDFYCSELCLAIEVDGGYHQLQQGRDKNRDQFLKVCGITTLRFSDKDILENIDSVKQRIIDFILSSPVKGRI
jgi:very-short-patch-repair endonuclease